VAPLWMPADTAQQSRAEQGQDQSSLPVNPSRVQFTDNAEFVSRRG
jgi:hypothetical protein